MNDFNVSIVEKKPHDGHLPGLLKSVFCQGIGFIEVNHARLIHHISEFQRGRMLLNHLARFLSRNGSNHDRPNFLQPGSLGNDFLIKIGGKDSSNVIRIKFWHD